MFNTRYALAKTLWISPGGEEFGGQSHVASATDILLDILTEQYTKKKPTTEIAPSGEAIEKGTSGEGAKKAAADWLLANNLWNTEQTRSEMLNGLPAVSTEIQDGGLREKYVGYWVIVSPSGAPTVMCMDDSSMWKQEELLRRYISEGSLTIVTPTIQVEMTDADIEDDARPTEEISKEKARVRGSLNLSGLGQWMKSHVSHIKYFWKT